MAVKFLRVIPATILIPPFLANKQITLYTFALCDKNKWNSFHYTDELPFSSVLQQST